MEDQRKRKLSLLFLVRFSVFKTFFIVQKHERFYVCMTEGLLRVRCLCVCVCSQTAILISFLFVHSVSIYRLLIDRYQPPDFWLCSTQWLSADDLFPSGFESRSDLILQKLIFFFFRKKPVFLFHFFLHLILSLCIDHSVFFLFTHPSMK